MEGCHCSANEGRNKNGSVNGLTVTFENQKEMQQILGV